MAGRFRPNLVEGVEALVVDKENGRATVTRRRLGRGQVFWLAIGSRVMDFASKEFHHMIGMAMVGINGMAGGHANSLCLEIHGDKGALTLTISAFCVFSGAAAEPFAALVSHSAKSILHSHQVHAMIGTRRACLQDAGYATSQNGRNFTG